MKSVEDLIKSREFRESVISEFGTLPESIMRHDKSVKAIDLMADKLNYASTGNNGGHAGKLADVFDCSGQGSLNGALSRFPQNVGRMLLLLYTKKGDTVVDPFAGHNSRMEMCWRSNRNYIGNDLSKEFMTANRAISAMLAERRPLIYLEGVIIPRGSNFTKATAVICR